MDDAKTEIAQAFDAAASEAVNARGRAPLVARGGKARLLKTDSGKIVTHGQVIAGLLARAEIEAETVDGRRPEWIACGKCGLAVSVKKRGPINKWCKDCGPNGTSPCECGGRKSNKSKQCEGCLYKAKQARIKARILEWQMKPERTSEQISESAHKTWATRRAKQAVA